MSEVSGHEYRFIRYGSKRGQDSKNGGNKYSKSTSINLETGRERAYSSHLGQDFGGIRLGAQGAGGKYIGDHSGGTGNGTLQALRAKNKRKHPLGLLLADHHCTRRVSFFN